MTIPFMMKDFTEMQSALDGLKEVTCILGSHNLAEVFLANSATRKYQALVTQHFALSTLERLGRNLFSDVSWQDALATAKKSELLCPCDYKLFSGAFTAEQFQKPLRARTGKIKTHGRKAWMRVRPEERNPSKLLSESR
ncbi:hypothetical protein SCAR479_01843 [Seiridium cardinale]|uniref:Uncharacterized protein n=1 Tax=Seiridium cardinale TaxID=138064 RepID=A0ABR2Y3W9_9PEZI